jgi:hypothetical protein
MRKGRIGKKGETDENSAGIDSSEDSQSEYDAERDGQEAIPEEDPSQNRPRKRFRWRKYLPRDDEEKVTQTAQRSDAR